MSGGQTISDVIERDPDLDLLAGRQLLRKLVAVAMRQVEDTPGDAGRGAVGVDVVEANGNLSLIHI